MRILAFFLGTIILLVIALVWWQGQGEIRYVALGDSYTIGTGVEKQESWPEILTQDLVDQGIKIKLVSNLAKNGKATNEVISEQLPVYKTLSPTFTTLLVGVNDFNRGYSKEHFSKNLKIILDQIKTPLVLITIPDFSVTPTGKTFGDPVGNSKGITEFNEIIKTEASARNIPVVDIFTLSQQMANDQSLVSSDQLHPSAREYQLWEKEIFPKVLEILLQK